VLLNASYNFQRNIPVSARVIALDVTDRKRAEIEAQTKEVQIFSHLEQQLHQWKMESLNKRIAQERQLKMADLKIGSMMRDVEVFND